MSVLTKQARCEPIAQAIGSSIFHVGQLPDYKGETGEIAVIIDGLRESRQAALKRLSAEAAIVGADAVMGGWPPQIPIPPWTQPKGQAASSLGTNTAEFIAIGTAVERRAGGDFRNPQGKLFQSDLSGQDFSLLIRSR